MREKHLPDGWYNEARERNFRPAAREPGMTELVFLVEEDPEGGFTARGVGESIFTQGETLDALRENVRDAVRCHYDSPESRPKVLRLHYVRDEVIAL